MAWEASVSRGGLEGLSRSWSRLLRGPGNQGSTLTPSLHAELTVKGVFSTLTVSLGSLSHHLLNFKLGGMSESLIYTRFPSTSLPVISSTSFLLSPRAFSAVLMTSSLAITKCDLYIAAVEEASKIKIQFL